MAAGLEHWRVIVVGGHTRSIGKTQLVCDLIAAIPAAGWIAGKITQYGHGVCAQNGENCDCAPDEHVCAISWEKRSDTGTDSARFLAAGASRSFWLRTKQGFLAEGLPLLRDELGQVETMAPHSPRNLILESNSLLQFWKPALYLVVLDPAKTDFKDSAKLQLDRASALVVRSELPLPTDEARSFGWAGISRQLVLGKPQYVQRQGEPVPPQLVELVCGAVVATEGNSVHRTRHL